MNDYARAPNQPLLTTSSPTFAGLTITGTATFASTVTVTTSISSPLYTSAANADIALSPGDNASATDTAGAALNLRSGKGRGAGAASSIVFQTPTVGSTGTTLQTLATRLTVATAGITATVPILFPAGTSTAPGLALGSFPGNGFYDVTSDGRLSLMSAGGGANGRIEFRGGSGMDMYSGGTIYARIGTSLSLGAALDVIWSRHSAANWRQGAAAANDADGAAQTLRSPGGGTVSSGTTGRAGGAYTITAGDGSAAKASSGANGGVGGTLTLYGGAGGAGDGAGVAGAYGGVVVERTGGKLGFYGTSPVALQTGVAVSAAGVHAALVNLGLITA